MLGHRQAFAWIDEWFSMSLADVRIYECEKQRETNTKIGHIDEEDTNRTDENFRKNSLSKTSTSSSKTPSPKSPKSPVSGKSAKSWFSWD